MVRRRQGDRVATLSGRIGAFRLHALYDPRQTTRNARKAFLDSFERQIDPHGLLPIDERQRRAAYAKKAHFARLARLSALARCWRRDCLHTVWQDCVRPERQPSMRTG